MKQVFNHTVIGNSHITNDIPCQDYSGSCAGKGYDIAVVADGHGAIECLKSDVGSRLAVECAIECLKEFVADIDNFGEAFKIRNSTQQKNILRCLTTSIVAKWHEKVVSNYKEDTPEDEQLTDERQIVHLYGTTLIGPVSLFYLPPCMWNSLNTTRRTMLKCPCGLVYVGKTTRPLKT